MARLAGLKLMSRSAGWRGELFEDRSPRHVSVYAVVDATDETRSGE
jgi:hypothetical protein